MMPQQLAKHIHSLFEKPEDEGITLNENTELEQRRYDIDWLRVILFGLLIPFHVAIGVYWSSYGTEINPNLSNDDVDNEELAADENTYTAESIDPTSMFLHWMHQWRLAALFMISGMGTAFAFKRRSWGKFLIERLQRLLVPMMFGMWTIGFASGIALEGVDFDNGSASDIATSLLYHIMITSFLFWIPIIGKIFALGHLWFLWNLFLYSLLMTPVFHYVQKNADGALAGMFKSIFTTKFGIGVFVIIPLLLTSVEILFKPWIAGFLGSGYEWMWFLGFFIFGYSCIVAKPEYYSFLENNRLKISGITIVLTLIFVWTRIQQHHDSIPYIDGGWIEQGIIHNEMTLFSCFVHSFHAWFWCLTVFSWGAYLLNKPSKNLAYMNQGVYPFYIVHMPITFAALQLSTDMGLKNYSAVALSCLLVTFGCLISFELLKRTKVSRYLFGIKAIQTKKLE